MTPETDANLALDDSGGDVANIFARRVLTRQAFVGFIAFFTVNLLAPWSLMLQSRRLSELWLLGLEMGAMCVIVTLLLSLSRMRTSSRVFRALALEPDQVGPEDIGNLASLPFSLTWRFVLVGVVTACTLLAPQVRPEELDDSRALSLVLLTVTIVIASGVVHYVAVRDATLRSIELSPIDPVTTWLERESMRLLPQQRLTRKLLMAVVAPVALVGVGTVLVAHAHLRATAENSRFATAVQLAHVALDPVPGDMGEAGRDEAVGAAAAYGFIIKHERGMADIDPDEPSLPHRTASGQLVAETEHEDGVGSVRYTAELSAEVVTTSVWVVLLAVLVAVIAGFAFGRTVVKDLALATQQVSSLGTESVLRGHARVAGPARFAVVAELGRSVEALAERFRVFAAAQERAIEAKAAGQRMKQLLFASVSHDLKSPLNAVLGFAELVREDPLTQAQAESLDMVSGRGRELLALIETILDAARVEAGELALTPQAVGANAFVNDALAKARDLHGGPPVDVIVELAAGMPWMVVDPAYAPRAVAVLIANAMETASSMRGHAVRLRLTHDTTKTGSEALLQIQFAAGEGRPSLLQAQLRGKIPSSTGRGMVLRLSLARAIIELHNGRVEVSRGEGSAVVVSCTFPVITATVDDTSRR